MVAAAWLTDAVAAASSAVDGLGLLAPVLHEAWTGQDEYGAPTYDEAVTLQAMVQEGTNQVRTRAGEVITTRACISFLEPVAANGAGGRREPIDPRDRFTLPSGYTGPIVDNVGAMLAGTSSVAPISVVWLR